MDVPNETRLEDLPEEVQARLMGYMRAIEAGICPRCSASDSHEIQIGRSVYCLECGARLFQGFAQNSIVSSAPIASVQRLCDERKPSLLARLFGKGNERVAEEQIPDIAGVWTLEEKYLGGTTTGKVHLVQEGDELTGHVIIQDQPAGQKGFSVKETIIGLILGDRMILNGTEVQVLEGETNYGCLDSWEGTIDADAPDTIIGRSRDEGGCCGKFVMRRGSVDT